MDSYGRKRARGRRIRQQCLKKKFCWLLLSLAATSAAALCSVTKRRGPDTKIYDSVSSDYVRWNEQTQDAKVSWDMQTSVTTFRRGNTTVELHAQLHFGEEAYFDYYNSRLFHVDTVLYELLTDEALLRHNTEEQQRHLLPDRNGRSLLAASPADQATAAHYGWKCQVDVINYSQPNWIHADLTRQEFLERLEPSSGRPATEHDQQQPLWQRSSPVVPSALVEAATALLVGPPLVVGEVTSSAPWSRRLFTNLFYREMPWPTLSGLPCG